MKGFLARISEVQTKNRKSSGLEVSFDSLPGLFDMDYDGLGGVVYLSRSNGYQGYQGSLSELDFQKYKKDIATLFSDFDDIFSKINKKYGLAPISKVKEKA